MSKILGFNFVVLTFSVLLLFSCAKEVNNNNTNVGVQNEEGIKTTVCFKIGELETYTTDTRAIDWNVPTASDYVFSTEIKNLVVIQFNGTDATSVVNNVQYIDFDDDSDGDYYSKVELLATYSSALIVFVANTFDSGIVTKDMTTLATFQAAGYSLSGNTEYVETDNGEKIMYDENLFHSDDEGNNYFTMSGYLHYDEILEGGETEITLMRNVAKVSFRVKNDWSQDGSAEITNVSLMSVPAICNYYTNRESTDGEELLIPVTVSSRDNYSNTVTLEAGDSEIFTYYVPANMRGIVSSSKTQSDKSNTENIPTGATYVSVYLTETVTTTEEISTEEISTEEDETEETKTVTTTEELSLRYNFYLGGNLIDDYNLKPNHEYAYDFTFTGAGTDNVDSDFRITQLSITAFGDYTQRKSSNCYILNPGVTDGSIMEYYIPIAPRINEYWGGNGYADVSANTIADNDITNWSYEVLWYDNTISGIAFEKTLKGEEGETPSLKISLDGTEIVGNILLAVKNSSGTILWSWHLWITQYNPYDHGLTDYSMDTKFALHDNINGYLHRYSGDIWETGIYKDKYMMDRNIGARSDYPTTTEGFLYYQFGRKDPFPYLSTANKSDESTFSFTTSSSTIEMTTAVNNPTVYYTNSGNWCNQYTGIEILWNDLYCSTKSTADSYGKKSIFDPSPYGFRVPVYEVWSNFTTSTVFDSGTAKVAGYGFNYTSGDNEFFYPACGYIKNGGEFGSGGTGPWGLLGSFSSVPASNGTHGSLFYAGNGETSIRSQTSFIRASGASIRCIEDEPEDEDEY